MASTSLNGLQRGMAVLKQSGATWSLQDSHWPAVSTVPAHPYSVFLFHCSSRPDLSTALTLFARGGDGAGLRSDSGPDSGPGGELLPIPLAETGGSGETGDSRLSIRCYSISCCVPIINEIAIENAAHPGSGPGCGVPPLPLEMVAQVSGSPS